MVNQKAAELRKKAKSLLEEVDDSYLLKHYERREYPTFDKDEVKLGPLLGMGGFGDVFEVTALDLSEKYQPDRPQDTDKDMYFSLNPTRAEDDVKATRPSLSAEKVDTDDLHYDVSIARSHMAKNCIRNGDARYAIKRLTNELDELTMTRGMIDMAMEAKFMSTLWHPNLVKMRGIASGSIFSRDFFIIMDRLYTRLDHRIEEWAHALKSQKGGLFGRNKDRDGLRQLMVDRMIVCYDLSNALYYMHSHKLVYRDIKQENIAFDVRGDVKIFDFGLCKSLSPKLRAKDRFGTPAYGYNLTPRTGSIPYLSPENVEGRPYDDKTDVFSLSILITEILNAKRAFAGFTKKEYLEKVVRQKHRPKIDKGVPSLTQIMLKEAWDHDPEKRPAMKRVAVLLRGDLNDMTSDDTVKNRTQHMASRTRHSMRNMPDFLRS